MNNRQQATRNTMASTMAQHTEIKKGWPPDNVTYTILYLFPSVETDNQRRKKRLGIIGWHSY
eukprot:9514440-Ditylum_brightwellii.AAC.1